MDKQRHVGEGFDRHRLVDDERLILGTVPIDSERGTVGHSDGDVLIHAMVDALLGAAGMGDIGQHFPEDNAKWKNVSSTVFLEQTMELLTGKDWEPVNVDATVVFESVHLQPYRSAINENIGAVVPNSTTVNVKFTTAEGLGPVGRGEAVEARAVTLIERAPS